MQSTLSCDFFSDGDKDDDDDTFALRTLMDDVKTHFDDEGETRKKMFRKNYQIDNTEENINKNGMVHGTIIDNCCFNKCSSCILSCNDGS